MERRSIIQLKSFFSWLLRYLIIWTLGPTLIPPKFCFNVCKKARLLCLFCQNGTENLPVSCALKWVKIHALNDAQPFFSSSKIPVSETQQAWINIIHLHFFDLYTCLFFNSNKFHYYIFTMHFSSKLFCLLCLVFAWFMCTFDIKWHGLL